MERRRYLRHPVSFPVTIDALEKKGRLGMVQNSSICGMLLGTQSRFEPGQDVWLKFRVTLDPASETTLKGRVIRVGLDEDADFFRRRVAVQFYRVTPALEPLLASAEA